MSIRLDVRADAAALRAADIRADADLQALRTATPDQIRAYVQSTVTDLPSAKDLLARLAIVIASQVR